MSIHYRRSPKERNAARATGTGDRAGRSSKNAAEALAVLRTEDPDSADAVVAQLEREHRDYEEQQREPSPATSRR